MNPREWLKERQYQEYWVATPTATHIRVSYWSFRHAIDGAFNLVLMECFENSKLVDFGFYQAIDVRACNSNELFEDEDEL